MTLLLLLLTTCKFSCKTNVQVGTVGLIVVHIENKIQWQVTRIIRNPDTGRFFFRRHHEIPEILMYILLLQDPHDPHVTMTAVMLFPLPRHHCRCAQASATGTIHFGMPLLQPPG